jgi:small subunit ribosomal protein S20
MARNKSAEKRHRQSLKRRQYNRQFMARMRTFVKKARKAVEDSAAGAETAVREAQSVLARTAQKGVISKKAASRRIGRLAKALHAATKGA